jgi:hypothetical protein
VDSTGDVGRFSSIALGADGLAVISYHDLTNLDLKVAKCVTATCAGATPTTVDSALAVGEWTSIALGADGLPVITYFEGSTFNLKVAKCANAACTGAAITPVGVGQQGSIAVGPDGAPVISYFDVAQVDLMVVKCADAACTGGGSAVAVDAPGSVGDHSSITIGADGLPVISYFDSSNQDVKVVKCSSSGCVPYVRRR